MKDYSMCRQPVEAEQRWASEKGFSLIECMIAMAIFSIGVLAVIGLQLSSVSGNSGSRKISDALVMAEDQLENFMSLPYNSADLDPALNPHQIDAGGYSMVWTVAMADLDGNGTDDAKRIQLTASHQADANRSTAVQYLIPEP